jgi:urease accessory protein
MPPLFHEGFVEGFWHPILGEDHLLAMVAVGLLSVQMGGRAIWYVPAAFVVIIGIGGLFGLTGHTLPAVEGVISMSVMLLGVAIASERKFPIPLAMLGVGFFAFFHGQAHGAELPSSVQPSGFVTGFMIATAFLHLTGVGLGEACYIFPQAGRIRALLGAGIAGIGLHLLLLTYQIV